MKIVFRILRGGSGNDIYFYRLSKNLKTFNTTIKYNSPYFEFFTELLLLLPYLKENPDLIHSNIEHAWAFKEKYVPLVATVHHNVFDSKYQSETTILQKIFHHLILKRNIKRSLDTADRIIAVSKYTRDSMTNAFGKYKIDVIYNGVDTDVFRPIKFKEDNDKRFRLLFVGNLIKRKGADLLPQIMEKLGDDYVLYYTSGLRSKIPGNFKRSNMIPLGRLSEDNLVIEYNKCDAFLFPTRLEGFGYAVAEAMACGKPVISTNCSSIPELIEEGQNGFLCKLNDVNDFVSKVSFLAGNSDLIREIGDKNRAKIIKKFSMKLCISNYSEFYSSCLKR